VIYDDFVIGTALTLGSHRFTPDEVRRFALSYDPQSFHVDAEAAKAGPFGALCASGWHTASVMMALLTRFAARADEAARADGRPVAPLGPSPGFDDLKWLRPVYPGDTITYSGVVVAKRPSASKPAWGIVSVETTGVNQDGARVFTVTGHLFAARTGAPI